MSSSLQKCIALIAAAGKSERMRKSGISAPKALAPHPLGGTLSSQLIDVFIDRVDAVVVTLPEGPESVLIKSALGKRYKNRVRAVKNAFPERGLMGSLFTALQEFPALTKLLFTPTDLSRMSAADVEALKSALTVHDAVQLEYDHQRGHPAGVRASLLAQSQELQTPKELFKNAHVLQSQNPFIGDNLNTRFDIENFAAKLATEQIPLRGASLQRE